MTTLQAALPFESVHRALAIANDLNFQVPCLGQIFLDVQIRITKANLGFRLAIEKGCAKLTAVKRR